MLDKKAAVEAAKGLVRSRIYALQADLKDLQEASAEDTKSSAGDKHETGRAMAHLEVEQLGAQLAIERQRISDLERIDLGQTRDQIGVGSLVETNHGIFLIAVACGKISVDSQTVFGLSAESPMGKALLYQTVGEQVEVNGKVYAIVDFS